MSLYNVHILYIYVQKQSYITNIFVQAQAPSSKLVPRPRMKMHVAAYPVASISGFVTNPTNDSVALMEALVTFGPQVPRPIVTVEGSWHIVGIHRDSATSQSGDRMKHLLLGFMNSP